MRYLLILITLIFSVSAQAESCRALNMEGLIARFEEMRARHEKMTSAEILADFQIGIEFIRKNIGPDSKQYRFAQTVMEESATNTVDDFMIVESLRIQIIPIMGVDEIYKEYKDLLLRDCQENLIAALILT